MYFFLVFLKLINKYKKKIIRCAPSSPHVSDFSYNLVSLKNGFIWNAMKYFEVM